MRALIAEEDDTTAALLLHVVAEMGGSAVVRWDVEGVWQALRGAPFDIALIGIGVRTGEVARLLRTLRSLGREEALPNPKTPVLLFGAGAAVPTRVALLDAGADQYLPKPVNAALASATIRSLIRRRVTEHTTWAADSGIGLDTDRRLALRGKTQLQLTPTQMEILRALAKAAPSAVTRQRLMASCSRKLSSSSLDFHIHHLRRHLGHHAIHTIRGGGYQLLSPAAELDERWAIPAAQEAGMALATTHDVPGRNCVISRHIPPS